MTGLSDTDRGRSRARLLRSDLLISICVVLAMVGLWQVLSYAFPNQGVELGTTSSPLVPGWDWIFTRALPEIAAYRSDGAPVDVSDSGVWARYGAAFAVLLDHSLATLGRLTLGFVAGVTWGMGCAVAIAWSPVARSVVALPAHVLRTLPALAMVPLVQIWFGVSFTGMVIFVAYGIGVILFAGTINAIENVPQRYIDTARTLGASKFRVYRTVVLPAIFPELRSSLVLSLALAWSVVVGAEFLGAQSGLGYIQMQAKQFALLDRMVVITLCFLVYSSASYLLFNWLTRPLVAWMPDSRR